MKILADECVHKDLVAALRQAGFEVLTAAEANLSGTTDERLFEYVVKTNICRC
jgi:predicted nuclease of predicted toxin-antitoxin system